MSTYDRLRFKQELNMLQNTELIRRNGYRILIRRYYKKYRDI